MSGTAPLLGKTKAAVDTSSYRAPASLPRAPGGPAVNGALPAAAGSSTTAVPFVLRTRAGRRAGGGTGRARGVQGAWGVFTFALSARPEDALGWGGGIGSLVPGWRVTCGEARHAPGLLDIASEKTSRRSGSGAGGTTGCCLFIRTSRPDALFSQAAPGTSFS